MDFRRRAKPLESFAARSFREPGNGNAGRSPTAHAEGGRVEWSSWLRAIERKRRMLSRMDSSRLKPLPSEYFAAATFASFRLDGIEVTETQIAQALARGVANKAFRTRLTLRIRNHISILRRIESAVRVGESLKGQSVVRWYTSISCGLSTAALDDGMISRLDAVVRRINSPQLRLQPAITEVARLHVQLLTDSFVPSFNGILARLLLQYHLGRCGLPPVIFDPTSDGGVVSNESQLLGRIMEMVDASYSMLLAPRV